MKSDYVFGMALLNPKKSGLSAVIWSEHSGILRKTSHDKIPRVIIGWHGDLYVSVTINDIPEIILKSREIKDSEISAIREGIEYVAKNHDIFLKHYMDTDESFDDDDMFTALRERSEYK
jgi:hypothetical protein